MRVLTRSVVVVLSRRPLVTCKPMSHHLPILWVPHRRYATNSTRAIGNTRSQEAEQEEEEVDLMASLLAQTMNDVPSSPQSSGSSGSHPAGRATQASSRTTSHQPARERADETRVEGDEDNQEGPQDADDGEDTLRIVELHNLPKNWMHEEIIEFLHQVANHAGIEAPAAPLDEEEAEARDQASESASAIPHVHSPFVQHLHIPFGRRTGLVYGAPRLVLRSPALVQYLVNDLTFEEDDYRNRIYFTDVTPRVEVEGTEEGAGDPDAQDSQTVREKQGQRRRRRVVVPEYVPIEETIEQEQAAALASLELDRYLLAPDLLLDISKMHQRRLVTRGEKVVLRAFTDDAATDSAGDSNNDDVGAEAGGPMEDELFAAEEGVAPSRGRAASRRQREGVRSDDQHPGPRSAPRAGTMKDLGHGSMHNMPIPKPYVMGRNL